MKKNSINSEIEMNRGINIIFPEKHRAFILSLILIMVTGLFSVTYGQDNHDSFYSQSLDIQNTGMYVLGAWAVSNIAAGSYGWARYSGERMYFHQMNMFWNVVNLSIAGFALYSNFNADYSALSGEEMIANHLRTERILLINAGLDVLYIGTGFVMRHYADKSTNRAELLKGYGSSVILQGAFLFVFDLVLYGVMRSHRLDFTNSINLSLIPDPAGLHLSFRYLF